MKSALFILLICLLGCHSSNSQSRTINLHTQSKEPDLTIINEYINTFFIKYKEEGTSKAVDYIFSSNKIFANTAPLNGLKSKLDSTRQVIGNYYGQELITEKNVSSDLVLLTYLVKHEKQPIRFSFIFYKPNGVWVLYKFQYDDQIISELEDSGKIYFLK